MRLLHRVRGGFPLNFGREAVCELINKERFYKYFQKLINYSLFFKKYYRNEKTRINQERRKRGTGRRAWCRTNKRSIMRANSAKFSKNLTRFWTRTIRRARKKRRLRHKPQNKPSRLELGFLKWKKNHCLFLNSIIWIRVSHWILLNYSEIHRTLIYYKMLFIENG